MRKSTMTITLTLLGPALLATTLEGCGRNCDPTIENCANRGSGTYIHGGSGYYGGGGSISGGTARGGFGGFGGGAGE